MSEVALWQLIKDWLPEAGWRIIAVTPPGPDGSARIVTTKAPHYNNPIAIIYDDKVMFWMNGVFQTPIKASDPMFFSNLDTTLVSIFSASAWYQAKMNPSLYYGRRQKIWPK